MDLGNIVNKIKPGALWRIIFGGVSLCLMLILLIFTWIDINKPIPEHFDVFGHIVLSDGSSAGLCILGVQVINGYPVGEMAQIVQDGGNFRWPLRPGTYELRVNCSKANSPTTGVLRVTVAEEDQTDLIIVTS